MKVSVIVPVYNVERYLSRCLDSIAAQTLRDIEIICVDDGSTDGSPGILAAYAAREPRMKVVTQANGGLSAARNAGLAVCKGDWVMFVDSDDWVPAYAAEAFLAVAEASGAPVVVSARYAVDEGRGGSLRLPGRLEAAPAWKLRRPALKNLVGRRKMQSSAWNKFYRADLVRGRRFIEGIYFEDWPFVTELFGDIDSFALVDEPLYVYCLNGDAASIVRSPFSRRKADGYVAGIRHVIAYFKDHPQRRWGLRRAKIAARMLRKRARRNGLPVPPDIPCAPLAARISGWFGRKTEAVTDAAQRVQVR